MVRAILLAAGLSSRLALPKDQLTLGSQRVLEIGCRKLLSTSISSLLLVLGPFTLAPQLKDGRLKMVRNSSPQQGLSSSLRLALKGFSPPQEHLLVALGDQPLIRVETMQFLLDTFTSRRPLILRPCYREQPGHPVFFNRQLLDRLKQTTGDRGGREIIAQTPAASIIELGVDDPGVLLDLDTWSDYLRLLYMVREKG